MSKDSPTAVLDLSAPPDTYDIAEKVLQKYKETLSKKIYDEVLGSETSLNDYGYFPVDEKEVETFAQYLKEVTDTTELQGLMNDDFSQGLMFGIYITANRIGMPDMPDNVDDDGDIIQ